MTDALADLPLIASGKVREIYDLDDTLLIVASDRISTYDVVHPNPIPDKGKVLTGLSTFWFERTADIVPNHMLSVTDGVPAEARGRGMVVRRLEMLPVEAVVRGYITGSGWKDYQRTGAVCGIPLPAGLRESDRLPAAVFTPSTKATEGHDVNISFEEAAELLGADTANQARALCLAAYERGAARALGRGIVIADTKFELGFIDGELAICDEILTPDSSRFWPAESWHPGATPPSFDKQPVRDWAESTGWDKASAPPPVPAEVIAQTRERYIRAYEQISGRRFGDWPGATGG